MPDGWTHTWDAGWSGLTSLNAQLTCAGEVTVNIYKGGEIISTATSKGEYAMAQTQK